MQDAELRIGLTKAPLIQDAFPTGYEDTAGKEASFGPRQKLHAACHRAASADVRMLALKTLPDQLNDTQREALIGALSDSSSRVATRSTRATSPRGRSPWTVSPSTIRLHLPSWRAGSRR